MRVIIISGGQSGADRGALLAARDIGVDYAGWVPRGGRCEDGEHLLEAFPNLRETPSRDYPQRTRLNVEESDVTIVVTSNGRIETPGSRLTVEHCARVRRPFRVVTPSGLGECLTVLLRNWNGETLRINMAGTRESKSPGIQDAVRRETVAVLMKAARDGLVECRCPLPSGAGQGRGRPSVGESEQLSLF